MQSYKSSFGFSIHGPTYRLQASRVKRLLLKIKRCFTLLVLARLVMVFSLPDTVIALILFHIECPRTGCALRATSGRVERAGEAARILVEQKLVRLNGGPDPFPEVYLRMSWWAPWVGTVRIYAPAPSASPAAIARFNELWRQSQVRVRPFGHYLEIHGRSSSSILHKSYIWGRGWVSSYEIWAG